MRGFLNELATIFGGLLHKKGSVCSTRTDELELKEGPSPTHAETVTTAGTASSYVPHMETVSDSVPHTLSLDSDTSNSSVDECEPNINLSSRPTRPEMGIDKLSFAHLGIERPVRLLFERFGIYMVAELQLYRREELIELRGVTQKTLSMIERKVASKTGRPFKLQGSLDATAQPRNMTLEEMNALDVDLLELKLNPLVARQLRRNSILRCRQLAFTSRDELLDQPGIDLETTYELEEALGVLLGVRVILGCNRGEPPTIVGGEQPYGWRLYKADTEKPTITEDIDKGQIAKPSASNESELGEDSQKEGVESDSTSSERDSDNLGDNEYWDDVFGWEEFESEWDDNSKWDWTNNGKGELKEDGSDGTSSQHDIASKDAANKSTSEGERAIHAHQRDAAQTNLLRDSNKSLPTDTEEGNGDKDHISQRFLVGSRPKARQTTGLSRVAIDRRIAYEVDHIAVMGKEYAPMFFYRSLSSTMMELGIHSDDELLDVIKHAYRRDPEVTIVDGNVIRFGKCDRRRQLEDFLVGSRSTDLDAFASGYKRKYGFGRAQVAKWLVEYSIKLPAGQSRKEMTADPAQTVLPIDLPDIGTFTPSSQAVMESTADRPTRILPRQSQMGLPISTEHVSRASRTTEYADFLRSELSSDCCDRHLITERFRARFPDGPEDPFNESMLWRLGYRSKGKNLLFREGIDYEGFFENLIDSKKLFSRGDTGFENAIFNDPLFRKILRRKMRAFIVVEYEKDAFISTAHLCKQMGVGIDEIRNYSQDVISQLRERAGVPVPFTIWSLRNTYGIHHALDMLQTEGGMSDFIYETLFDIDPHVQCCTISKKRCFLETDGGFDTGNFIELLIEMNGPMEIDDIIDLLKDAYGIDYQELPLHHTIRTTSLYYDDITDSVYNSRYEWEEMVNRELA